MKIPVQVTFRNVEPSEMVEKWIRDEATRLETFYSEIMGCRVTVEMPHRHQAASPTERFRAKQARKLRLIS